MPLKNNISFISVVAALSGLLFGYDAGIISGALLFIEKSFSINDQQIGFIVSAVPVGALLAALAIARITDLIGRKKILGLTALAFILGSLLCGLASSVHELILGRFLLGLAVGWSSSSAPLYIAEMTEKKNRGRLVTLYLIAVNGGLLISYMTNYLLAPFESWRWMLALGMLPGGLFAALIYLLPESPRWLVLKGKTEEARSILKKIHGPDKADLEMREITQVLKEERFSLKQLFYSKFLPIIFLGIMISIFTQAVGINAIIYYAPMIFQQTGFNAAQAAILATVGIGFTVTLAAVLASLFIDKIGRRQLLLWGLAGIILSLLLIVFAFACIHNPITLGYLVLIGSLLFVLCQGLSVGPACFLLPSEIFPARIRGTGMGISIAFNWLTNAIIAFLFPMSLHYFGPAGSFGFFLITSTLGWILFYYFIPETKNVSLERIELNLLKGRKCRDLGETGDG
jgi:SP family galactose:H+ symporter-like MFS transporter